MTFARALPFSLVIAMKKRKMGRRLADQLEVAVFSICFEERFMEICDKANMKG